MEATAYKQAKVSQTEKGAGRDSRPAQHHYTHTTAVFTDHLKELKLFQIKSYAPTKPAPPQKPLFLFSQR